MHPPLRARSGQRTLSQPLTRDQRPDPPSAGSEKRIEVHDKTRLIEVLRETLCAQLGALERRQRDTADGATHEESRAEHAKDTRATEQSYLARGLAERVEQMRATIDTLASFPLRPFDPEEAIAVGALVELADLAATSDPTRPASECWWIVPAGGGLSLDLDAHRVRTVTPAAPLGRALLGLVAGDEVRLDTPRGKRDVEVLRIG